MGTCTDGVKAKAKMVCKTTGTVHHILPGICSKKKKEKEKSVSFKNVHHETVNNIVVNVNLWIPVFFIFCMEKLDVKSTSATCATTVWATSWRSSPLFLVEHHFYLKKQLQTVVIQTWEFGRYFLKNEVSLSFQRKNLVFAASDKIWDLRFQQN